MSATVFIKYEGVWLFLSKQCLHKAMEYGNEGLLSVLNWKALSAKTHSVFYSQSAQSPQGGGHIAIPFPVTHTHTAEEILGCEVSHV